MTSGFVEVESDSEGNITDWATIYMTIRWRRTDISRKAFFLNTAAQAILNECLGFSRVQST